MLTNVAADLHCFTVQVVNVCFYGTPRPSSNWVLIDTGMPKSAETISSAASELFGNTVPKAIILTHGHFDHVGAVEELASQWNVPVYAHQEELPYLNGKKDYPEPDTTVEGGMVAKMSKMFPNEGIDLKEHIHPLPADGTVPEMPGWNWVHTPGHTPGHISLFREEDQSLIAGDAFVTVKQEQLYKVLTQEQEISGPPRYLTTDWPAAKKSVHRLQKLHPKLAVTGHGLPLAGEELEKSLDYLVTHFDTAAIPDYGKFVEEKK
ncbi:MBL fold metallo-hydrolase [Alteribacillus sp. HJP-4]|uniref:MBL fold metallo-hydrolase n=1 Tax=Alteribacillus sp. HJP-4 TaxID=2775394 RepID=UPI0035CCC8B9